MPLFAQFTDGLCGIGSSPTEALVEAARMAAGSYRYCASQLDALVWGEP